MKGISTRVTFVRRHFFIVKPSGGTCSHTNSGLRTRVLCVINHSLVSVIWRDINNGCILESVRCSLAVCVRSPTVISMILSSIVSACTVKCNMKEYFQHVHCEVRSLNVIFVTNHSPFGNIGSNIKSHILRSDHITVVCVICRSFTCEPWKNICSGIMTVHIPAVYVVKFHFSEWLHNTQPCTYWRASLRL
jgi:hypothetical protein